MTCSALRPEAAAAVRPSKAACICSLAPRTMWTVVANFKLTPKWDRVRQRILDGTEIKAADLSAWVAWANGLQSKSPTERLLAINTRVNKEFKYATDQQVWGQPDHWDDPREAVEKKRMDCEDFAIFKLFLAHIAGIQDDDLAIGVGKIPSTGEHHAIMFGADGRTTYVSTTARATCAIPTPTATSR